VFAKWCSALATELFGPTSAPNTTAIFWTDVPSGGWQKHYAPHSEIFAIYTNLSAKNGGAKEQARVIRKTHLEDNLGVLGIEPKAASLSKVEQNTRFGHCAETLALTRCFGSCQFDSIFLIIGIVLYFRKLSGAI
jgi:hypothetical protein